MDQSKTQICLRNYDDLLNQQAFNTIALKIHENCMKMCQNDKFQKKFVNNVTSEWNETCP